MSSRTNFRYVFIARAAQETGYTAAAIRTKLRRGLWVRGKHWLKAPDNRVLIDLDAIQKWISSAEEAGADTEAVAEVPTH